MAVSESYINYIEDQLLEFGQFDTKKMFGGIGIFRDGLMFAKIDGNEIFRLKVDASNQKEYEDRGMKPFYSEKKKQGMPYWEVPNDIIENKSALADWANRSFEVAKKSSKSLR